MTLKDLLDIYCLSKMEQVIDLNFFHYFCPASDANLAGSDEPKVATPLVRAQQLLVCKEEKILYLFLQAINIIEKLTVEFGIINYNISPLNLTITNSWTLILTDFSVIDFVPNFKPQVAKKVSADGLSAEMPFEVHEESPVALSRSLEPFDDVEVNDQQEHHPMQMRSQFKR